MTNQKYHRCRRALERLGSRKPAERARLEHIVREYRNGNLRAINGKTRRHPSRAAA